MDLMIDLETLGKKPGCVILSIGAVMFDEKGMYNEFYQTIDVESSVQCGLTIDPGTVLWWMKQSDNARHKITLDHEQGRIATLAKALHDFKYWAEACCTEGAWGHGSVFDISILEAAYKVVFAEPPWKFYMVRDTRTLFELAGVQPKREVGTHHNALDDAKAQAAAAIEALNKLGISLEYVRNNG